MAGEAGWESGDALRDGELAALAARVAELERQVAELRGAARPAAVVREAVKPVPVMPVIPPPPPPMPLVLHAVRPELSLENRLGSQVFNLIGIAAILIGAAWFLKLAIEHGWIGPAARVIVGLGVGAGLVLWSESFRRKGMAAFSYSLKAVGASLLYLSLWAAMQLYTLLPAGVAFAAMAGVTAWIGFMAWSQDAELLALYGLVGGFATPLLLSTGGDHEAFLFTYVAVLDLAVVLLLRAKPWRRRLLLVALAATAGYYIGYFARFFHTAPPETMDAQSWETAAYAVLFFALFELPWLKGFWREQTGQAEMVLPVLGNAVFVSLALYSVLEDSGLHSGLAWLAVGLAAVYLELMRRQATAVGRAVHLAMAVVFLTIAIPLKASGQALTTAWLVEGLVLYWIATPVRKEDRTAAEILQWLSSAGYVLGLASLTAHWFFFGVASLDFFNTNLGSALVAVAALGGGLWLASEAGDRSWTVVAALLGLDLVGVLLVWRELVGADLGAPGRVAFANAEFATALVGLAILAGSMGAAWRLAGRDFEPAGQVGAGQVGAGTLVLFNLLAILSVVQELGALWPALHTGTGISVEASLQRSLAVSGFLMAYAAGLLAVGFWRRAAFVRWQGLVLLLFTIGKVFFYDVSGLSQGYRVASFLTLGVLLMGVSFAYQKDWLGLKRAGEAAVQDTVQNPVQDGEG